MEEKLIKFETAKLAKEKGFDWKVLNHYRDGESYSKELINGGTWYNMNCSKEQKLWNCNLYSAPTQSYLQKWLREVHKINNLNIFPDGNDNYVPWRGLLTMDNLYLFHKELKFKTYEEALEKGLQEALKLI
jgi:hypothetical protein